MKNLILNELRIYRKDRKTQLLCLLLILASFFFPFIVSEYNLGNLAQTKTEEVHYVQGSLDTVSEMDRLKPDGSEKYNRLVQQESLISKQQMSLIMEMTDNYLEKEKELNFLQLKLSDNPEYADILAFIPPRSALEITRVTNDYLISHHLPRAVDNLNGVNFTLYFLGLLLTILSIILFFFSADILVNDYEHESIIRGFPVNHAKRIWAKIMTLGTLLWCLIGLGLLVGFLTMAYRFEVGPLNYPVGLYYAGNYHAVSFGNYLLLLTLIIPCLIVFILLFAACLNIITRNLYLTLFVQLAGFIVFNYLPQLSTYTFWLPFHYLNLQPILTGQLASDSLHTFVDIRLAGLVLIGWSLLLTIALQWLLKYQAKQKEA